MDVKDFLNQTKVDQKNIKYKITKVVEKNDYIIIYLDNDEKLSISIENYLNNGLSSVKGLDENLYQSLIKQEKVLLGYNSALKKLSLKDYTIKQISDSLYTKYELHKNEVEQIITKLKNYGLLDDDKYCVNKAKFYDIQLKSYKQIVFKLQKDGISDELIKNNIKFDNDLELSKIKTIVSKLVKAKSNKSSKALKQSLLNKLVSLGFNYDNCIEVINSTNINNVDEIELLNKEYIKAKTKYEKKYDGYELRNHIYNHLINKGFLSKDIKKVMEV